MWIEPLSDSDPMHLYTGCIYKAPKYLSFTAINFPSVKLILGGGQLSIGVHAAKLCSFCHMYDNKTLQRATCLRHGISEGYGSTTAAPLSSEKNGMSLAHIMSAGHVVKCVWGCKRWASMCISNIQSSS